MQPRILDMSADRRKAHYDYFRTMANPYASVTVNCDITHLRETVCQKSLPMFLTVLYCAANAANDVPELRRRIRGETAVEYDSCDSSHTVALPDGTYCYCRLDCRRPFAEFIPYALEKVQQAKRTPSIDDGNDADSLLFVTTLPWISFTSVSLPTPSPADSNPRITFGRFFEQDGRILMPVSLTVHHALADGRHMAAFFETFDRYTASL